MPALKFNRQHVANSEFTEEEKKIHGGGYKTVCTCAVLSFYGIDKKSFKFCQSVSDMVRIFNRNGFRASFQRKKNYIGAAVSELNSFLSSGYYLIQTSGHVLLIYITESGDIQFTVDTMHNPASLVLTAHRITLLKK